MDLLKITGEKSLLVRRLSLANTLKPVNLLSSHFQESKGINHNSSQVAGSDDFDGGSDESSNGVEQLSESLDASNATQRMADYQSMLRDCPNLC